MVENRKNGEVMCGLRFVDISWWKITLGKSSGVPILFGAWWDLVRSQRVED